MSGVGCPIPGDSYLLPCTAHTQQDFGNLILRHCYSLDDATSLQHSAVTVSCDCDCEIQ